MKDETYSWTKNVEAGGAECVRNYHLINDTPRAFPLPVLKGEENRRRRASLFSSVSKNRVRRVYLGFV